MRNEKDFTIDEKESRHSEQAIHSSQLDKMTEAILSDAKDKTEKTTVRSLTDFTTFRKNLNTSKETQFERIEQLIQRLSPTHDKVFWINLIQYAYICRAICKIPKGSKKRILTIT